MTHSRLRVRSQNGGKIRMVKFDKPNATGRNSGKVGGKLRKIISPPKGGWTWLTRELMQSDAWQKRSVNCMRLIDFLMIDHMNNGGMENGRLQATHKQLHSWGMPKDAIRTAVDEAEFLGLVKITRQGGRWGFTNQTSLYRLTFLPTVSEEGVGYPANNEWKPVTAQMIEKWHEERIAKARARRLRKQRNSFGTPDGRGTVLWMAGVRDGKS